MWEIGGAFKGAKGDEQAYYNQIGPEGCTDCNWVQSEDVTVTDVKVVDVDASDPPNTKINYETVPFALSIPSVSFSAPGTTGSQSNVSGSFHFTYDPADIGYNWGENTIRLSFCTNVRDCTVTKSQKMLQDTETLGAYFAVEGVGQRFYGHTLRETYNPHVYSVTYTGKTIETVSSDALMDFNADIDNISFWVELHRYTWTGGSSSFVLMTSCGGLMPPDVLCREVSTVDWFQPGGLTGIGKCAALVWDYGGGTTPGIITNSEVDRTMPE